MYLKCKVKFKRKIYILKKLDKQQEFILCLLYWSILGALKKLKLSYASYGRLNPSSAYWFESYFFCDLQNNSFLGEKVNTGKEEEKEEKTLLKH